MNGATKILADFVSGLRYEMLPPETINIAKTLIMDYLGALIAAYDNNTAMGEKMTELILSMGGAPQATIIGQEQKVPVALAALGNGTLSHIVELDDGHRIARGHPGVSVISASLPMAEYLGVNGKQLLTAIVAGYDIFVRLASSINPVHLDRGFHTTGTCGTVAAAAACANLLGLDPEGTLNALGLGGLQAAGLIEVAESGQMAKPMHAGKAAFGGVLAGLLAKQNVEGPKAVIEGKKGIAVAMSDRCDFHVLLGDLGKHFHINDCYIKLYPSCRHTHSPVDAVLELKWNEEFDVGDVEKITVVTFPAAISIAGQIFEPVTAEEAKFSIAYCVCAALYCGNVSLRELKKDYLENPDILSLTKKVVIEADQALESDGSDGSPKSKGAQVNILLRDGRTISRLVLLPKGEQENPVGFEESERKFYSCTSRYLDRDSAARAVSAIMSLDEMENTTELIKCLSRSLRH